jgi:hypothetical protein
MRRRGAPTGCVRTARSPCPLAGCRRKRSSFDGDPFFTLHLPLRSTDFHRLQRYYEEIRLLHGHRLVVVASFRPTARLGVSADPCRSPRVRYTECTAAPVPNTAPISVGFWASRSFARSPDRPGLPRASLSFGAAARLRLPPHTSSRRVQLPSACGCYQLAPQRTFTSYPGSMPGAQRLAFRPPPSAAAVLTRCRQATFVGHQEIDGGD